MYQRILITTTNSIEGMEIEKYYDLISTNVVLGSNVFSDIGASFSDFFGGTSEIYQNKLERIYKIALDKLKQKAKTLNANGIVGVKIDFDEVSGGGKSMFMISVAGMAVKLRSIEKFNQIEEGQKSTATPDQVENIIQKLKIISKVNAKIALTENEWEFLLENSVDEVIPLLLEEYLLVFKDSYSAVTDHQKRIRKYFPLLLKHMDEKTASKILYKNILVNPIIIITLLKESESFDPEFTLELLESGKGHISISSLEPHKRIYTYEDLKTMTSILEKLNKLPATGKIETVKGILGSKEKYICENNHNNPIEVEFCGHCGKNIKGLSKNEAYLVNEFEFRVEGLKLLLN